MPKRHVSLSRSALLASGALRAYLHPKLAADAALDVNPLLRGVTAKNWQRQKPKIVAALTKAAEGKLAQDADLEDVADLLDTLDEVLDDVAEVIEVEPDAKLDDGLDLDDADEDLKSRLLSFLDGKLSEDDLAAVRAMLKPADAGDAPAPTPETAMDTKPDAKPETVTRVAMDAAIAAAAAKAARDAETRTMERLRAIQAAEREVRPFIGELAIAQDSAAAVYKLALDHLGVALDDVPEAAYGAILRAMPKPQDAKPAVTAPQRLAMDAASVSRRAEMFPNANRLSRH